MPWAFPARLYPQESRNERSRPVSAGRVNMILWLQHLYQLGRMQPSGQGAGSTDGWESFTQPPDEYVISQNFE